MATVELTCDWCGTVFNKPLGDYNDNVHRGVQHVFCSRQCAGKFVNGAKIKPRMTVVKCCPVCNTEFKCEIIPTYSGKDDVVRVGKTYCSRGCASKASVTDYRRNEAQKTAVENFLPSDVNSIAKLLKKREGWKYAELSEWLTYHEYTFEFEKVMGNFVYDLYIEDNNMIVEFDGSEHNVPYDKPKDNYAASKGITLVRIKQPSNQVIAGTILADILRT